MPSVHLWLDSKGSLVHVVDVSWESSQHPRGQPENAGEFAPKGGGASGHTSAEKTPNGFKAKGGGELPAHIAKLRIPPAWKDVTYSEDPQAPLQVTGKDAAGRTQYVYSESHAAKQAAAKFARIKTLDAKLSTIRLQNEKMRKSSNPTHRALGDVTALIMDMGVRPGSDTDTQAKVKAYGATTLEGQHVVVMGNKVSLKFVGKKGVALDLPVEDPSLSKMLRERKQAAGNNGRLFGNVNQKSLLDYVHSFGGGFKTKDFRTLVGTKTAMKEVTKVAPPANATGYKKAVMQVAKVVAAKLGNTPTVALQSYISPVVFAPWGNANV
jgi:DNA topoisomerase-1